MTLRINHADTINHPEVKAFLVACAEVREGVIMSIEDIAQAPLIPYAEELVVVHWDHARQDFHYRLWGSSMVEHYGMELSGKYFSDGEYADHKDPFVALHLEAMQKRKLVYISGEIDWRERAHKGWNQVTMPLRRGGEVTDTLSYIHFESVVEPV